MLPLESRAICGGDVRAGAVERALGVEKVAPPSVERLKKMSPRGGVPSTTLSIQTTLMLPAGSTAICGKNEWPVLFEIFFGVENVCASATSTEAVRVSRTARAARLINWSKKVFTRITAYLPSLTWG